MDPLRVGIVGASPDRGWAVRAHVPALQALEDYRITAVGTSRADSAQRARQLFGAAHAFTDPRELAEHPEVDLVAITVKVPAHAELIRAAVAAGKHVYCEWPLALHAAEAESLARLAEDAGVRHVVGLQTRYAPAVVRARRLLAEGFVGEPVSVTVYCARQMGAGTQVPGWAAYTLDRSTGAGVVEVVGGHTLDAVEYLIGGFTDLSARLAVSHPQAVIEDTGETIEVTSPNHLLLDAATAQGVVISAHIHDSKVTNGRTRIEISGTAGDLAIVSGANSPGGISLSDLRLVGSRGGGEWQPLGGDDPLADISLGTEVGNVARLYAAVAHDVRTDTATVPTFHDGVRVHRLLDTIRRSADTATRMPIPRARVCASGQT
ncbi:putative dehydrogenase [Nocardia tenerifensis]|uniref:Putative dehydrogenase n=1 Tax=Nocardia tenerifensis TaxID=228006 RepID=A0A318KMJ9_9NOCA|nr:Gfo/Idh/MocA family oxidoreductase [Nocardia tenerifensis]PXX70900.1 putative dehydrogenase [Nocardia tenerifensis]